jgi:cytochrome c biogenesis protein CcdA
MILQRRARTLRVAGLGAVLASLAALVVALVVSHGTVADALERLVGVWQNALARATSGADALGGNKLYVVALLGGLAASLSPCILGMLPVNLSYIGAVHLRSRGAAFRVATAFVCGVIVVNAILGLFSSLFFAVFVQYREPVNIAVGLLMIAMGLGLLGAITIPIPSIVRTIPKDAGPFLVGLAFALVATPCASPVLVAVLAAAAKTGSSLQSVLAMTIYSIGYTAILFAASLFAGIATASRSLLAHGGVITRFSSIALIGLGVATIWYAAHLT